MDISKPYTLGKSQRLKSRKQIDILFETGKKISHFPFRIMYRIESGEGKIRAGFTVSSKIFPRAIDRNRIKRLIREAYRLQKKDLELKVAKNNHLLHLFIIYTGKEIIGHAEVALRIKQILDKLLPMIYERNPENT